MFICLLGETVAWQAAAPGDCHSSTGKIDEALAIKTNTTSFDLLLGLFGYTTT